MPKGLSRQVNIEEILKSLIQDGLFICAVVASSDGLPLAMVGHADTTMMAAVSASMKDLAERAHQGLTEIITRDDEGNQIINRYFSVDQNLLLLSAKIPRGCAYRRLMNNAVRNLKEVWAT